MVAGANGALKPENIAALSEALDDVHTRFILNLPDAELENGVRVFFQLEQVSECGAMSEYNE